MFNNSFPLKVLFEPGEAFAEIAAGRTGWAWPSALYALSAGASVLLFKLAPPEFVAESFEGLTLTRARGFFFYFAFSLAGGLLFTAFICSLISALSRFLEGGRLSARIIAAGLAVGVFGITAAAMHGAAGGARAAGIAAGAAAVLFSGWAAFSGRQLFPRMLKGMLAVSALSLAASLPAGAAVLAGSVKVYTGVEYLFSILSLYWLAKAVSAVYGASKARAAAATVLALFGGLAFLFLVFNLGLLPPDIFEALLLV
ncbi:MAG TPA: hypothetical protein DEQ38_08135 [Elusimicrobia bacterium]|nr:MAG: hypothetical protein A2089_03250 [Elusimicrobia bacterium GWD2_63_28]HCC48064.1 hypothetical protein [Elusimicrobiota bacterium]